MIIKNGSAKNMVQLVQTALIRSGFLKAPADGIYGEKTRQAVINFQTANSLVPDGIVGKNTFAALRPYLTGYTTHIIKKSDTLSKIASQYNTTVAAIENANPSITYDNLQIGTRIIVPFLFRLTPTNIIYSSLLCELICEGLAARYPFLGLSSAGTSFDGRQLAVLKMGKGSKKVFINAAHHANEWITTPLTLKFVEEYADAFVTAGVLGGQNGEYMYDSATLFVMPMVNPDGVDLVTGAIDFESQNYQNAVMYANNYPQISFPSGWKANIRGVDLNLNYPAMWERARQIKFAQGFTKPGPRDYVGLAPLSEPESRAVFRLTNNEMFDLTVSMHTQGEEIYWQFQNYAPPESLMLGQQMADVSGYTLASPAEESSYAGYKDWFLMTYSKPGYTVEAGLGKNPLPIEDFDRIYRQVLPIFTTALAFEEPIKTDLV